MKTGEMKQIAEFIERLVLKKENPDKIRREVTEFRKGFQKIHYAFETATEAYEYVKIRS